MGLITQTAALLLFLMAERLWPRAGVSLLSRETWLNLATGGGLFALRTAIFLLAGSVSAPHLIPLHGLENPLLQFLFAFLIGDLARYGLHRAHHEVAFLWQFHRVHHSCEKLNITSGLRMHVVDFVQLAALPLLLFGVLFDTSSFSPGVWIALGAVVAFMDAFQHADLRFSLGNPLARAWYRIFNTPHFHSWHHTRDWEKLHGNYGQALTIWDRLFGSAIDLPEPARDLGLPADQALDKTLVGMQLLRGPSGLVEDRRTEPIHSTTP